MFDTLTQIFIIAGTIDRHRSRRRMAGDLGLPVRARFGVGWAVSTIFILDAAAFAIEAHGDQKRKYTGEPYVMHCFEVARLVATRTTDETMIAAALLHDTVEDTDTSRDDIENRFGARVADLVHWLSDLSTPSCGNRATRKAIDRAHIAAAPPDAKTIKLADLISNTRSIAEHDPGFARVYLHEKEMLLGVLKTGDREMLILARETLRVARERLGI